LGLGEGPAVDLAQLGDDEVFLAEDPGAAGVLDAVAVDAQGQERVEALHVASVRCVGEGPPFVAVGAAAPAVRAGRFAAAELAAVPGGVADGDAEAFPAVFVDERADVRAPGVGREQVGAQRDSGRGGRAGLRCGVLPVGGECFGHEVGAGGRIFGRGQ